MPPVLVFRRPKDLDSWMALIHPAVDTDRADADHADTDRAR